MMLDSKEMVIRLLVSAIIGGLIGLDREKGNQPAGLRTHILVTVGSTLVMLVSMYGFVYVPRPGDSARLAAQVISGIGFLGAGTIFKGKSTVRGLTTAAGLWVSAGLGLAVGAGMYIAAGVTALITIISLTILNHIEEKVVFRKHRKVKIVCQQSENFLGDIEKVVLGHNARIINLKLGWDIQRDIEDCKKIDVIMYLKFIDNVDILTLQQDIMQIEGVESCQFTIGRG